MLYGQKYKHFITVSTLFGRLSCNMAAGVCSLVILVIECENNRE